MKFKFLGIFALLFSICSFASVNHSDNDKVKSTSQGILEITFDFTRGGRASSQYAVWIEDAEGKVVKTIYATSFTAEGGYNTRESSLPVWVKKSEVKNMAASSVDAITGATPSSGKQTYYWDGTGEDGKMLPKGDYKFFIESTYNWHNQLLFSGDVKMGSKTVEEIHIKEKHSIVDTKNEVMIKNVKATYTPKK